MYKNKNKDGSLNISGKNIKKFRLELKEIHSQRLLADKLQLLGLDLDKNAIQKIEAGQRFVTDIELKYFAEYFKTTIDELITK